MRCLSLYALLCALLIVSIPCSPSHAHDLWIETSSAYVRTDEVVSVAFKLGNCDEGRRDFKTKGIADKSRTIVEAVPPSHHPIDILAKLTCSSHDAAGGYWVSVMPIHDGGTTWFLQALDQTIEHDGRVMRGIVTAKAFVIAGDGKLPSNNAGAGQLLELPVQFQLLSAPFPSIEEQSKMRVRLLVDAKPIEGVTVSFLPQAINLQADDDSKYEVQTDSDGVAEFQPQQANLYLISARHVTASDEAEDSRSIYYSTSLTLRVSHRAVVENLQSIQAGPAGEHP